MRLENVNPQHLSFFSEKHYQLLAFFLIINDISRVGKVSSCELFQTTIAAVGNSLERKDKK